MLHATHDGYCGCVCVCDGCDKLELCNSNILINKILPMCRLRVDGMGGEGKRAALIQNIFYKLITAAHLWKY